MTSRSSRVKGQRASCFNPAANRQPRRLVSGDKTTTSKSNKAASAADSSETVFVTADAEGRFAAATRREGCLSTDWALHEAGYLGPVPASNLPSRTASRSKAGAASKGRSSTGPSRPRIALSVSTRRCGDLTEVIRYVKISTATTTRRRPMPKGDSVLTASCPARERCRGSW